MTFLFSMPNIPGIISQTLSSAEFQQGALGITFNMVIYRAPFLTPKTRRTSRIAIEIVRRRPHTMTKSRATPLYLSIRFHLQGWFE
jgi:hypothetical protein